MQPRMAVLSEVDTIPANPRAAETFTMYSYPLDNFALHATEVQSAALMKPMPEADTNTPLSPSGVSVGHA